jgi:hypothetical protein
VSTYTDGESLHHHISLIHHDGMHHINLFLEDGESCSMRYKSGTVVSVTLMLEAFEYVVLKLLLIIERLLGNYALYVVSPRHCALVSGHPWGNVCHWEVSLMSHHTIPDHTYHFPHFILFVPSSFGIFGFTDLRRDCTSFHVKKGLKTQRLVAGRR